MQGGDGNDILYGGADNDRLFGQTGNDLLYGGDSNDLIFGFMGTNELKQTLDAGESDNDFLYGGSDQHACHLCDRARATHCRQLAMIR